MPNPTMQYQKAIADIFIKALEEKQLDWKKSWQASGSAPYNATTQASYRGRNRFYLSMVAMDKGYTDPRWCTYLQCKKNGWRLDGEHGTRIEIFKYYDKVQKKNISLEEYKKALLDPQRKATVYAMPSASKVFNGEQIHGIPPLEVKQVKEPLATDVLVSRLSEIMGVTISNDGGSNAYYSTASDSIHLPAPQWFLSQYDYDSTALHELAHATGATSRLNRDMSGRFGSEKYAYEELVAEIGSCFMSSELQCGQTAAHIDNHKAYVQSWIKAIREKPETLLLAIGQAERVSKYMEQQHERALAELSTAKHQKPVAQTQKTNTFLSKEQIAAAKSVELLGYVKGRGYTVKPHGGGLYKLIQGEHDSLIIYPNTNSWYNFSDQKGGDIIKFLTEYEGLEFNEAAKKLLGMTNDISQLYQPIERVSVLKQEDLQLPNHDENNKRVFAYLIKTRELDRDIVKQCIDNGSI